MRKKQIAKLSIFTIIITFLALYFQWTEFYKGYSYSEGNLIISAIFLFAWTTFSFCWGIVQEKKYLKFIIIYWGIGIISTLLIWIFANNQPASSFLFPFYIWYGGPIYGFRYLIFMLYRISIGVPALMLIILPLEMLSSFAGYWIGLLGSKLKNIRHSALPLKVNWNIKHKIKKG